MNVYRSADGHWSFARPGDATERRACFIGPAFTVDGETIMRDGEIWHFAFGEDVLSLVSGSGKRLAPYVDDIERY